MTDERQEPTFARSGRVQAPPPRRRPRSVAPIAFSLLAVAIAGAAGWFWLMQRDGPPVVTSPPLAAASPEQAAAPAEKRPELPPLGAEEAVKPDDITAALTRLLGRDAVLKFLETTDFPRRAVATLDNLGREHAPVTAWPVQPAPARFLTEGEGESQVIAARNAARYAPFVAFVDSIDAAQAVDLYRRMYPVLQQAYRDQGFANRTLHERMFEVIDLLLATPEPAQPPRITLTEVKGPIPSARPWVRYEYVDPSLQRLAAGQKMLLRVGPDHRKVLKAKLRALRQQLLQASTETSRP